MRITIKSNGVRLRLWFPLAIIKSRIGYNSIQQYVDKQRHKQLDKQSEQTITVEEEQNLQVVGFADTGMQVEQVEHDEKNVSFTREQMVAIYNTLKQFVKTNGHFKIVEVESHDGEKVIVSV